MAHNGPHFITTETFAERVHCPRGLRHLLTPVVFLINVCSLIAWPFSVLRNVLLKATEPLRRSGRYGGLKRILQYNLTEPRPKDAIRATGFAGRVPVLRWLLILLIVMNWACLIAAGLISGMLLYGKPVPYARGTILGCTGWIAFMGILTMLGQGRYDRLREACRSRRRAENERARAAGVAPTVVTCELWPACWKWSPILNETAAIMPTPYMVTMTFLVMVSRSFLSDRLVGTVLIDLSLATAIVAICCLVRAFARSQSACREST